MKAFQVRFNTAGSSGFSELLLVKNENELEQALADKSMRKYRLNSPHSKIVFKEEVPLSQIKIGDLSITEFLELLLLRDK